MLARTQDALVEPSTIPAGIWDAEYAAMAADEAREAEAAEWSIALLSDAADDDEERRPAAEE